MSAIRDRLVELFSWDRISAYLVGDLIPDIIVALLVFSFFWLLYRALAKLASVAMRHSDLDKTARDFIQTVLRSVVLAIAVVSALSQVGINTGALLTSLGVAGLTLGFAAKDTLSNIISGLFIFWDRPFVVDDLVEIDRHYGRVDKITMRTTRVVTVDGRMLAIPNSTIVNSTVASYTNFPHLRLDVPITLGLAEDIDRARELLLSVVDSDDRYLAEPPPRVVVTALNDYNVQLEMRAWIVDERDHIPMRLELRQKMFETLRGAGIEMPLETLALAPLTVRSSS